MTFKLATIAEYKTTRAENKALAVSDKEMLKGGSQFL
jgi:hypothetical protein